MTGMFQNLTSKDMLSHLTDLNGKVGEWAEAIKVPSMVLFIAGIVLALLIGLVGYRLSKPTLALLMAGFGYAVGNELFAAFIGTNADKAPGWVAYVVGGVVALLFLVLSCLKPKASLLFLAAFCGYMIVGYYAKNNAILSIGGAIVMAMIGVLLSRAFYITVTSVAGGAFAVSFLSQLLPKVELLQIKSGAWIPLVIMAALAVLFIIIQAASNKNNTNGL